MEFTIPVGLFQKLIKETLINVSLAKIFKK